MCFDGWCRKGIIHYWVPKFLSSCLKLGPPTPPPPYRVSPLTLVLGWAHPFAEMGGWETQFRRLNRHSGTLYSIIPLRLMWCTLYRLPRTAALARRDSEGSAANLNLDLGMLQIFYSILLIYFTIFLIYFTIFYLYILQYSTYIFYNILLEYFTIFYLT
jgi:hypothetical protein